MPNSIDSETAQAAYDKINALKDRIDALPAGTDKDELQALEADLHTFANDAFLDAGGSYRSPDEAEAARVSGPVILSNNTGNKGHS